MDNKSMKTDSNPYHDIGRLLISCPDRPGIVAAVSRFLYKQGANIIHSDQHSTDPEKGAFFMRVEFYKEHLYKKGPGLEKSFHPIAKSFDMDWRLAYAGHIKRLAVFVSKEDHALFELLWRHRAGDLRAKITMVISNHPDLKDTVKGWGVPFYHVPVLPNHKDKAEKRQLSLIKGKVDRIILARYMQIIGRRLLDHYPSQMINIHHSFLPAFIGANSYGKAHERGVKLIGATAHYVTQDLDAGPIIEQDVQRVDHRHTAKSLKRIGQYIERVVLARAVSLDVEDRILVHGNKTVVFG